MFGQIMKQILKMTKKKDQKKRNKCGWKEKITNLAKDGCALVSCGEGKQQRGKERAEENKERKKEGKEKALNSAY